MLHPMAATAPPTTLTFNSTHAVITGVRYQHLGTCRVCRKSSHTWSDNGELRVGLHIRNNGKTCRWYSELHPAPPVPHDACPHCGATGRWWYPMRNTSPLDSNPYYVSAMGDAYEREQEVYARLREVRPEACERADRADARGHKRFPAPKGA
ncbi:hypothetical protein [Nocardiopsis sp. FR4]|uniref:hypothetical protein n=1 Tax=Nocardiopsis sp. FR4 TaxID=2605985 RepID=UPI001359BCE9|nr:hypothetical protein [Nocardiopsis sp. FR4]